LYPGVAFTKVLGYIASVLLEKEVPFYFKVEPRSYCRSVYFTSCMVWGSGRSDPFQKLYLRLAYLRVFALRL
jgi:hypothetical protein